MTSSQRNILAVLAALCVTAVTIGVLMRRDVPPPIVIASDDGTADLTIPARALPDGVDPKTITVTRVTTAVDGVLAKYDLRPSGLVFSEPAKLAMRLALPEQTSDTSLLVPMPTVILQDADGSAERVATTLSFDAALTRTEVVVPVRHFSTVTSLSFVDARIDDIGDKLVRQPFLAGARVTQTRTEIRIPIDGDPNYVAYVFTAEKPYLYSGRLVASANIEPEVVRDIPKSQELANSPDGRATYAVVRTFSCTEVGDATMLYIGHFALDIKASLADAQDRRTPVDFETPPEEEDELRIETPPYRCIAASETSGDDIILDGGDGTGSSTTTLRTAKGVWEAVVRPSTRRAAVGEAFTIDAVITDVSDRLLAGLPEADRAKYRTPWEAEGTWHVVEGIYDRAPMVPAERRESPFGARLTYRLPVRCESAGVGPISLEISLGRLGQPTPSIVLGLPHRAETRLPAVYVECVRTTEQPPEPLTEPIRFGVSPTTIQQAHRVGTTKCPQRLGTVRVDGPPGGEWSASGIPTWITMPESGPFGDIDIVFNCNIEDTSPHRESATISFTDGRNAENVGIGLEIQD